MRGKGVPQVHGGRRGDLVVHLKVTVPNKLNREQRKLFEQLLDILPVDNTPTEKGLFEKVKDYFS
jgi:molecular chaperone DnaJ